MYTILQCAVHSCIQTLANMQFIDFRDNIMISGQSDIPLAVAWKVIWGKECRAHCSILTLCSISPP